MNKHRIIFLIVIIILNVGCSTKTHLGHIPINTMEFQEPIEKIQEDYPEVKKYIGPYRCGVLGMKCDHFGIYSMPPMYELLDLWGDPSEITGSLWNLSPAVALHPIQKYIWYKGSYRIEVTADNPALFYYEPHLWYWQWYLVENKKTKNKQ